MQTKHHALGTYSDLDGDDLTTASRRPSPRAILDRLWILAVASAVTSCQPENTNHPPVASAGDDIVAHVHAERGPDGGLSDVFDTVVLDASGSVDPDGDTIVQYYWAFDTIPVGSHLTYDAFDPNSDYSPQTQFTPDHEGTYGITLEVFDGHQVSALDYVQVIVVRDNNAPIADAGPDMNGPVGTAITLDGSASTDPDGDFLSYRWDLVFAPETSTLTSGDIVYAATAYPRITPDVAGVYALSLEVDDGFGGSASDLMTVTAIDANLPPVVDPGVSRTITPCHDNPITLDGSGSYDPDGDPMEFQWTVTSVPYGSQVSTASLSAPDQPVTTVALDRYGLYVFMLTLSDGVNDPAREVVAILFDDGSSEVPPVAYAGGNQQLEATTVCGDDGCAPCDFVVPLDGTGSYDLNDDPLSFEWTVTKGDGDLVDPSSATPELRVSAPAPDAPGYSVVANVQVELVVSDCFSESSPSVAVVTLMCEGT